ncbi:MAG: glucose-6-phosphate isomerase [Burkholderiaceae bacterium]
MTGCEQAWRALEALVPHYRDRFDLRQAFDDDPARFDRLSLRAPHIFSDLSKQLWDVEVLERLVALAEACGLPQRRAELFAGRVVNPTENRPALHVRLRKLAGSLPVPGADSGAQPSGGSRAAFMENALNGELAGLDPLVRGLADMLALAEAVRARDDIDDVIHIGIGGSGVGPELSVEALRSFHSARQRLHFVANMDGHDLAEKLARVDPQRVLFVAASRSWSTAETLLNTRTALRWLSESGVADPGGRFVAITGRPDAARALGIERILDIPEGIGGRFSLWSAVGLPLAIAIGASGFAELLAGAADMDEHFEQAPLADNLPVRLGLIDVWHASLLGFASRCVVPYHHGLRRLPAYLQQLEMESNGKRVRTDGSPVERVTTPVLWGGVGSNDQHAFFQWLHQGTQRAPVEFIAVCHAQHPYPDHQQALLCNALAQAQALMQGARPERHQLPGHQDFPGNRPSGFFLIDRLTPAALGALLALHEHRVFTAGHLWRVNSFDQWGVELGKKLANELMKRMLEGDAAGLDPSTAGLMALAQRPPPTSSSAPLT